MRHDYDLSMKGDLMPTGKHIWMAIFGSLCLLIASSALWFNQNFFNVDNFTKTVTQSLESETSRNAVAAEVVNRLTMDKPLLKEVITEPAEKLVAGVLGSSRASSARTKAVREIQTIATSPNPESVTIDLTSMKTLISKVVVLANEISEKEDITFDANQIPDEILVLDAAKVPSIYHTGSTLLWVGPLALGVALALFIIPLVRFRKNKPALVRMLSWSALSIAAAGLLGYVIGPMFKPSFVSRAAGANMQVVMNNLFDSFLHNYNQQLVWFFVIAFLLAVLAVLLHYFNRNKQNI